MKKKEKMTKNKASSSNENSTSSAKAKGGEAAGAEGNKQKATTLASAAGNVPSKAKKSDGTYVQNMPPVAKGKRSPASTGGSPSPSGPFRFLMGPKQTEMPMEQQIAEARAAALQAAALAKQGIILEDSLVPNKPTLSQSVGKLKDESFYYDITEPSKHKVASRRSTNISSGAASQTTPQTVRTGSPTKSPKPDKHKKKMSSSSSKEEKSPSVASASKDSSTKSKRSIFGKRKRRRADDASMATTGSHLSKPSSKKQFIGVTRATSTKKVSRKMDDTSVLANPNEFLNPTDAKRLTRDLWTCCLCSAAFDSKLRAEKHEKACVHDACQPHKFFVPFGPAFQSSNLSCPPLLGESEEEGSSILGRNERQVVLGDHVRDMMIMTDESVLKVVNLANLYLSSPAEREAERALALYARKQEYYRHLQRRAEVRRKRKGRLIENPRSIANGTMGFISKMQDRLNEAYELIKEGEGKNEQRDYYSTTKNTQQRDIEHSDGTLYLNVLVKNSTRVVSNELERLSNLHWKEDEEEEKKEKDMFGQFRSRAQKYVVKLASLAMTNDFNPRRIATKTSNDFYRLLPPELKRRGVKMETEIEYRTGPFFVLAVNILSIDWIRFIQYTHYEVVKRNEQEERERNVSLMRSQLKLSLSEDENDKEADNNQSFFRRFDFRFWRFFPTIFDLIGFIIHSLYYVHWTIAVLLCYIGCFFQKKTIDMYICQSVVDDLYRYMESKGMEMDLTVKSSDNEAAFMLGMLRKIREDDRKKKKAGDEKGGEGEQKPVLGPFLGPPIKEDKGPAVEPPDFLPPEDLEYEGISIEVPVGFRRLRWGLLRPDSEFEIKAVQREEEKYLNIVIGEWDKHNDMIGEPNPPPDFDLKQCVGATREQEGLMPANAMVKANTAYSTLELIEYNDHCFAYKKKTRTPDVPFGGSFFTWTQYVIINLGNDSCRLICSSAAEFPSGRPMVARQIESGIRSGTTESFVRLGETICRYA